MLVMMQIFITIVPKSFVIILSLWVSKENTKKVTVLDYFVLAKKSVESIPIMTVHDKLSSIELLKIST